MAPIGPRDKAMRDVRSKRGLLLSGTLFVFLAVALTGCEDQPTTPEPGPLQPQALFDTDGSAAVGHEPTDSAYEGFFWLPPLVEEEDSFEGTANTRLSPIVRVCAEDEDEGLEEPCDGEDEAHRLVAEFTRTNGTGDATIRTGDEHYQVNWNTDDTEPEEGLEAGSTYRVWVMVPRLDGEELVLAPAGFIDVFVGGTGQEARTGAGDSFGLVDGRTLPLRFRLEAGVTGSDVDCELDCGEFVVTDEEFDECTVSGEACLEAPTSGWLPESFEDEEVLITIERVDPEGGETGDRNLCFDIGLPHGEACYTVTTAPDLGSEPFREPLIWGMCQAPDLPDDYVLHQRPSAWPDEDIRIPTGTTGTLTREDCEDFDTAETAASMGSSMTRLARLLRPAREFLFGRPLQARDNLSGSITSFSDFFYAQELAIEDVSAAPAGPHPPAAILPLEFQVVSDHGDPAGTPVEGIEVSFSVDGEGAEADPPTATSEEEGMARTDLRLGSAVGDYELTASLPTGEATSDAAVQDPVLGAPVGFDVFQIHLVPETETAEARLVDPEGAGVAENPFQRVHFYVVDSMDPEAQTPRFFATSSSPAVVDGEAQRTFVWTVDLDDFALSDSDILAVGVDDDDVIFRAINHRVTLTSLSPESPATLVFGQEVEFHFDYTTTAPSGVRIWGRPITDGEVRDDFSAHPSPLHPQGEGSGSGFFTIDGDAENVVVDHIRFQMWDVDEEGEQDTLLFEKFVPVEYAFVELVIESGP